MFGEFPNAKGGLFVGPTKPGAPGYVVTQMMGTSIMVLGSKCVNCRALHRDEEAATCWEKVLFWQNDGIN